LKRGLPVRGQLTIDQEQHPVSRFAGHDGQVVIAQAPARGYVPGIGAAAWCDMHRVPGCGDETVGDLTRDVVVAGLVDRASESQHEAEQWGSAVLCPIKLFKHKYQEKSI
jgi:hypothetical protein